MRKLLCVTLCILLCLTGCGQKESVHNTGFYAPYYIADANVVWADKLNAMQFDKVSYVEKDGYGREYYRYTTYSVLLGGNIEIHLISQQAESERVYYYPDVCYIARLESAEPFTEEQQVLLKSRNDWNQPFSWEKCNVIEGTQKTLVYEDALGETLREYLKLDDSYGVMCNELEWLTENRQFYAACVFSEEGERSYYILVCEKTSVDTIIACERIYFSGDYQDVIKNFRQLVTACML